MAEETFQWFFGRGERQYIVLALLSPIILSYSHHCSIAPSSSTRLALVIKTFIIWK